MPIKIKSTGGGSVSIDVPNTGSDFTLTAPANNSTLFTTSGGTITGNVAFTSNNVSIAGNSVSPFTGFKNRIINGDFDIWQRGTSGTYTVSNYTGADRWIYINDGTAATGVTISRQTFTVGQTDVPGNPKYFLQLTNNNLSGAPSNYIRNQIEGVGTLAGQTGTYSFWGRVTSGTAACSAGYQQEFGTGGSPSAGIYPAGQSFTLTTTWQKFSFTFDFPSITGKTLGTNNNDKMNMAMYLPTTSGQVFQFARVQLEEGPVATPFEKRPIGLELMLCMRFYQRYTQPMLRGVVSGQNASRMGMMLPVEMRAAPTVTLTGTTMRVWDGGTTTNISSIGAAYLSTKHIEFDMNLATNVLTTGRAAILYTDGSDSLILDAEV